MSEVFHMVWHSEESFSILRRYIYSAVDYEYRLVLVIKVKVST
jgi:hypothetical protein